MYPWILIVLVAASFWLQHHLDARHLSDVARASRWTVSRITWAPLARLWAGSRWERCYWLRYFDESGGAVRRLCRVTGMFGIGFSVQFDPVFAEAGAGRDSRSFVSSQPRSLLARLPFVLACTCAGAFVGAAIGIGGSFVLYPSSNVAPAYGILLIAPIGMLAGLVFGIFRAR